MKKLLKAAEVRQCLNDYNREDISFSRMVEQLNEVIEEKLEVQQGENTNNETENTLSIQYTNGRLSVINEISEYCNKKINQINNHEPSPRAEINQKRSGLYRAYQDILKRLDIKIQRMEARLNRNNVASRMFTAEQMEHAYNDGAENEENRCGYFDIDNYR